MSGEEVSGLPGTEVIESATFGECTAMLGQARVVGLHASQVRDEELARSARRIQGRAVRQAGKLLREVDGRGGHRKAKTEGDHRSSRLPSRKELAESVGLSEHQQRTATRIARIPRKAFEQAIESDDPPSVTTLARMGTKKRKKKRREPKPKPSPPLDPLRSFDAAEAVKPEDYWQGLQERDVASSVESAKRAALWLSEFLEIADPAKTATEIESEHDLPAGIIGWGVRKGVIAKPDVDGRWGALSIRVGGMDDRPFMLALERKRVEARGAADA